MYIELICKHASVHARTNENYILGYQDYNLQRYQVLKIIIFVYFILSQSLRLLRWIGICGTVLFEKDLSKRWHWIENIAQRRSTKSAHFPTRSSFWVAFEWNGDSRINTAAFGLISEEDSCRKRSRRLPKMTSYLIKERKLIRLLKTIL